MNEDNEPNGSLGPEIIDTRDEKIGHISPHLTGSPPLLRVVVVLFNQGTGKHSGSEISLLQF